MIFRQLNSSAFLNVLKETYSFFFVMERGFYLVSIAVSGDLFDLRLFW